MKIVKDPYFGNQRWHICHGCKKKFFNKNPNAKYCTHECSSKKKMVESVETICGNCGVTFFTKKCYSRKPTKFCSKSCYHASTKTGKTVQAICDNCGVHFTYTSFSGYERNYCSRGCATRHRAKAINKKRMDSLQKKIPLEKELALSFIGKAELKETLTGVSLFEEEIRSYLNKGNTIKVLPFIKYIEPEDILSLNDN